MRIIVVGGTRFLGRHVVDAALARGHQVTVFHRGITGKDLPPGVMRLVGHTDGNTKWLKGFTWDAAIDTCGYFPRVVNNAAYAMYTHDVGYYVFISCLDVYRVDDEVRKPGMNEKAPLALLPDGYAEQVTVESHGPLKAWCENLIDQQMGGSYSSLRAGPIVGPRDDVGRFTYWVRRVARGGTVLAPGRPDRPIQFVDARDLADWAVRLAESRTLGAFNTVGPAGTATMRDLLETIRRESASDATFVWAPDEFMKAEWVEPLVEMPFWVPEEGKTLHYYEYDNRLARESGLTFRPLEETVRDTLAWDREHGHKPVPERDFGLRTARPGMAPEREAELLGKLTGR